MKRFLPSTQELWASAGMLLVIGLAIGSKEHARLVASALICLTTLTALHWGKGNGSVESPIVFSPEKYDTKQQEILKDL